MRNEEAAVATVGDKTEAGAGAAAGAVSGGIIGGVIGAAAALLIPGFGPAIAGGILLATLGGVAIGAAAGGLLGTLIGMGVPEEEARYYEGEFGSGRTIVTVRADGRQQEAMEILHRNGGYDANTRLARTQVPSSYGTSATPAMYGPNADANPVLQDSSNVRSTGYDQSNRTEPMVKPDATTSGSSPSSTTASPQQYDPITGVTETERNAPVKSSGYGLQRDPTVETDATAKTYDTNVRPDAPLESRSKDSLFGQPVEPGTVEPGSPDDPNVRPPRIH